MKIFSLNGDKKNLLNVTEYTYGPARDGNTLGGYIDVKQGKILQNQNKTWMLLKITVQKRKTVKFLNHVI